MSDYKKGKVYRLVCNNTGNQYIGSTTQSLSQRLGGHKTDYKRFIDGKMTRQISSFSILCENNFEMILIEEYSCENKNQLERRERYFIETMECVNKVKPSRTREEKKEYKQKYQQEHKEEVQKYREKYQQEHKEEVQKYHQKYYQENKEELQKNQQKYRQEHKEELQKYQQERKEELQKYRQEHKEERKEYWQKYRQEHKEELQKYRQEHKEERKEYDQKYQQEHKEKIKEQTQKYWQEHKEKIKEHRQKYYQEHKEKVNALTKCECGGQYQHSHKSNHFKTLKHKNWLATHETTQ
jgi:hypothetical protein